MDARQASGEVVGAHDGDDAAEGGEGGLEGVMRDVLRTGGTVLELVSEREMRRDEMRKGSSSGKMRDKGREESGTNRISAGCAGERISRSRLGVLVVSRYPERSTIYLARGWRGRDKRGGEAGGSWG